VIVAVDNRSHRTVCPHEKTAKLVTRLTHQIEVVEVDIKD